MTIQEDLQLRRNGDDYELIGIALSFDRVCSISWHFGFHPMALSVYTFFFQDFQRIRPEYQESLAVLEDSGMVEKLEEFNKLMESQRPLFKFVRDYMRFVGSVLMFIQKKETGIYIRNL
jgi:hypothetical protein